MDPEIYQFLTWTTTCCMWRVEKVLRPGVKKNLLFYAVVAQIQYISIKIL